MKPKAKLSEVGPSQCYRKPGRSTLRKKLRDGRIAEVGRDRRVRYRSERGDPEVEIVSCPLKYLGVGQPKFPETVIEIGRPKPRKG